MAVTIVAGAYAAFTWFLMFNLISPAWGLYCAHKGVGAGELRAKCWAFLMRASEVVLASSLVYLFWVLIAHYRGSHPSTTVYIVGALYSLIFGGTYVLGSLTALLTIPMGSQTAYFSTVLSSADDTQRLG